MARSHAVAPASAASPTNSDGWQAPPASLGAALDRGQQAAVLVLAVALGFVVLFWRLGTPTFWDPDEAHYAETTREMITSRDWWVPRYNEQTFFDKPVLFHQLQGAAMIALGPTELAARIVPALAAVGLVVITLWFGAAVTSMHTGILAALLLLVSPGLFGLARYAILDTLFTMFLFGGVALLAVAALRDRSRLQWPGYVLIALAVLTKGPLALVLPGLTFVVATACSRELRDRLLALRWITGLALVILLSAPWFVYMYARFGDAFVKGYFVAENVQLYAGRRFGKQPGFWFYFQILAAGLLPWTGLVVGRLYDDLRVLLRGERLDGLEMLLWIWTAGVVAFFSFSTFKLDHYIFPAAPALCLLCARAWSDLAASSLSPRHVGIRAGAHLIGPLMVAVGLGCGYFLVARLDLPRAAASIPVALTLAGAVVTSVVNVRRGRQPRIPWLALSALLVVYAGLNAFVMPALEQRKVVDDIARWTARRLNAGDRVATYRMDRWNPTFRFYVGQHVTFLEDPVTARFFFESPGPFYCLLRKAAFDEFAAQGVPLRIVMEREGLWATSGRAMWREHVPTTQFVLVTRSR